MHFRFLTSTPLDIRRGSGTFAGISTLAKFLRLSGETVDVVSPSVRFPIYTLERILFNQMLRSRDANLADVTVGFDMDGYAIAGASRGVHIASIKGVIADEMRFEAGLTRATMRLQARCERLHVRRASMVLTSSRYSAERIQEFYGISKEPRIVPEAIDLTAWRKLFELNPAQPAEDKFTVLCVCRFYPRKRLNILLGAVERLSSKVPGLDVRIVGDGPEAARLKALCREKRLDGIVKWLGSVSQAELARQYNQCHVFCLPSVQEGFGIVFLEAMASGKPIVAARTAAIPEVVKHGILVQPDDAQALAEGIERLYREPELRKTLGEEGARFVERFDGPAVADLFLQEVKVAIGVEDAGRSA
jgi:glycosyltransferase involved in cell wall biosynthesis